MLVCSPILTIVTNIKNNTLLSPFYNSNHKNNPMRKLLFSLAVLSAVIFTSCAPSMKITGNWMNKDVMGKGKFQKVFIYGITPNEGSKQSIEDALAKAAMAEGVEVVKSYEVFGPNFPKQSTTDADIVAKIKETGCDAVFTTSVVDVQSETRYVPGSTAYAPYPAYGYYGSFGGYYSHSAYIYEPGYYTEDNTYFLESNLYDVENGEIVWSVQSEAYNPSNTSTASRQYAALLFDRLKKEGISSAKKK